MHLSQVKWQPSKMKQRLYSSQTPTRKQWPHSHQQRLSEEPRLHHSVGGTLTPCRFGVSGSSVGCQDFQLYQMIKNLLPHAQCHKNHMGSMNSHYSHKEVRLPFPPHWGGDRGSDRRNCGLSPLLSVNEDTSSVVAVDPCGSSNQVKLTLRQGVISRGLMGK